jgi:predicted esterase
MDSTFCQNSSLYWRRWSGIPTLVCPFTFCFVIPKINAIRFDIHQFRDLSIGPWDEGGILETVTSIHGLIEHEIKANSIPAERIVVAGLSQGSAMAVWSGLTFTGGKLAGICGIAGRLPAKDLLQEVGGVPASLTVSEPN